MPELFLVPVSDDWIEQFHRTVTTEVEVDDDAPGELEADEGVRIWGTTVGEDSKKRSLFEKMNPGDPVLFLHDGTFIGSGRVGETYENPDIGEWLWDNPESRFIYTVTDYEAISVPRGEVWDILGYSSNYPLYGFSRASDDAISSLLQTYNSVEEAFQDLRSGDDEPEAPGETIEGEPPDEDDTDPREHTEIQYYLVQLGLQHGYDVYVATNDKNREYDGERLGEECVDELNLTGFSQSALNIIEYVDVIWLDGDYIAKMFEVESTTSIYSGILRMTDFVVKVPNLAVDMYIVAAEDDADKVRKEMNRPTFQAVLDPADHSTLQYRSFEDVRETYELVEQAGPLQQVF